MPIDGVAVYEVQTKLLFGLIVLSAKHTIKTLSFTDSLQLKLCNNPNGMYDSRNVAENRQYDVNPKMFPEADLKKNPYRGKYDSDNDSDDIHFQRPFPMVFRQS